MNFERTEEFITVIYFEYVIETVPILVMFHLTLDHFKLYRVVLIPRLHQIVVREITGNTYTISWVSNMNMSLLNTVKKR